jgi:hypothetical protein
MLDVDTSSPLSTSSWMISTSLTPPNGDAPYRQLPSPRAKSSPSPSSPGGRGSPAGGTYTATPRLISEQHFALPRLYAKDIEEIALKLGVILENEAYPYRALDSSAMPVRDAKRRGHGWLAGQADIGWSNSLGWYEGFTLMAVIEPSGIITCFCFGPASTADPPLAETFFAVRANPDPRLKGAGSAFTETDVAVKGFEGEWNHRRWLECYGADVVHPPKRNSRKRSWSKRLRRWIASIRQIVDTVYDKLFNTLGLWRERPHEIGGLRARLASRVALHNFCIWLNDRLGRPRLKFADLMG